ncbi:MAG: SPOR domain-containing protein [Myxococcales bacterium]|nr:SPOR domain-containing protein [Myxococcales bacterium]
MSDPPRDPMGDPPSPAEDQLLDRLAAALTESGDLLPITEEEVRRAEATDIEDVDLPAGLADYPETLASRREAERGRARGEEPAAPARGTTDLAAHRERRRPWLSHGIAVLVGAAAAATLLLVGRPESTPGPALSSDPVGSASSRPPAPETIPLSLPTSCEACCAGADCSVAKGELQTCPSGRRCIACDTAKLATSRYRLRLGAVSPQEGAQKVLEEYPQGKPELCVRAGMSEEICMPSLITKRDEGFSVLPALFTGDDLRASVHIRLRWQGVSEPKATAARWAQPVALSPRALCHGYVVALRAEDNEEPFGLVSLFLDDTHHVELGRAATLAPLETLGARLSPQGFALKLQETRSPGDDRFTLMAGPFDHDTAEALRWQLLDRGLDAEESLGSDYRGEPKTLP